ncbi:MAG: hypothetical protein IPM16_09205 [Chloroflexi bacterium]|nr:hypothetical protein [Chloroflexota bacterium]
MQSSRNFFEQAMRQTGWRPQRQAVALAVLGAFLALIMGGLYLSQVASEAARGREMRELLTRRDDLERVNEELRVEIAELQSLERLRRRAGELGFVAAGQDDQIFIVVNGYNPNRGQTVAPLQEVEEQLPVYDESFGGWLQQQLRNLTQQFEQFSEDD